MVEHVVLIGRNDYEQLRRLLASAVEDLEEDRLVHPERNTETLEKLRSALRKLKGAQ